jgi:hypothetical protein
VITGPEEEPAAACGHFRAAHADREHVIDTLKTAFADGRLTKDELDARAGQALTAWTYAELAVLTADIPAGPLAARPPDRPQNRPKRAHPVRNAAIGSVSCLSVAAAAFLYGVSLDDHTTLLFLLVTFLALVAVPCIIGYGAVISWQLRHPRRQLPPRPGQGGPTSPVQRHGSTAHDPSPLGAPTDQTRADLRVHRSRPDRPRRCGRDGPVLRRARPVPGAA